MSNAQVFLLQDGGTPLFVACQCGHLPVVDELIRRGANVNSAMKVIFTIVFSLILLNQLLSKGRLGTF